MLRSTGPNRGFVAARAGWLALMLGWGALSQVQAGSLMVTVLDAQGRALPDAVVSLESPAAARAVAPTLDAHMSQRKKTFVPGVLPITRGTELDFPNEDTVRHHVYSFSAAKKFELKLYSGTPAKPVLFDQPGLVVLGCNIHDHMIAWVLVLDTPYFGKTDAKGALELRNVPEGDYRLKVWHNRLPPTAKPYESAQTVTGAGATATVNLTVMPAL